MIYENFDDLFNDLNRDTEFEKNLREQYKEINKYSPQDFLNTLKKYNIFKDENGQFICYPSEELKQERFLIEKHYIYNSILGFRRNEYIEGIYVLKGQINQTINGEEITLRANDFCLLGINAVHRFSYLDENVCAINIKFTRDVFKSLLLSLSLETKEISNFISYTLYSKKKPYHLFHLETTPFIKLIFDNMLIEYYSDEFRSVSAIKGYILILFTSLARIFSQYKINHDMIYLPPQEIKEEISKYIDDNIQEINLNRMAENFHFSATYLSKLIKKMYGDNFQNIIIQKRLKLAILLIENTENSIDEIIEIIGYSNKTYFYKKFKLQFGMTPKEYREYVNQKKIPPGEKKASLFF